MKITIVIDTDDERGIRDSYKIVNHFYSRIATRPYTGKELRFGKIQFIKMLRKFAKGSRIAETEGEDTGSLKWNKVYADRLFAEDAL